MLGFGGIASNPWDILSPLQAQQLASSGGAAGGVGAGQFAPDGTSGQPTFASAPPSAPPPTGTIGQVPLSPDVLGFLIWNQSQQSGGTASAGTAGSTGTAGTTGTAATAAGGPTDTTGTAAGTPFQALFSQLAGIGDGAVSPSELQAAFGANGNAAAGTTPSNQINPNGNGSIDPSEFAAVTQSGGAHGHHHHHAGFADQAQSGQSDPLANVLGTGADGASTSTATNADGSTTTTITYADGSAVTLTTPAQASSATPTTTAVAATQPPASSNNILETLIQLQAQLLTPTAAA